MATKIVFVYLAVCAKVATTREGCGQQTWSLLLTLCSTWSHGALDHWLNLRWNIPLTHRPNSQSNYYYSPPTVKVGYGHVFDKSPVELEDHKSQKVHPGYQSNPRESVQRLSRYFILCHWLMDRPISQCCHATGQEETYDSFECDEIGNNNNELVSCFGELISHIIPLTRTSFHQMTVALITDDW